MSFRLMVRLFLVLNCFFQMNFALAEDSGIGDTQSDEQEELMLATENLSPEMKKKDEVLDESFSRYRDIYFLVGSPESKLQFSLKIRPIHRFGFYVTYTQVMFWSLMKDSKPFKDINFAPEAFYQWNFSSGVPTLLRLGVQHKSNGKAEEDSRSFDNVFADIGQVVNVDEIRLHTELRFFYVYDIDWITNRNINDYLGIWNARVIVDGISPTLLGSDGEVSVIGAAGGKNGLDFKKGRIELGIKYGIKVLDVLPSIMVQFHYGYLESLLSYDKLTKSARIGFLF